MKKTGPITSKSSVWDNLTIISYNTVLNGGKYGNFLKGAEEKHFITGSVGAP